MPSFVFICKDCLHCNTPLHYTIHIALHFITLHHIVLEYITLHYITLHYIAFVHYIALHQCITLHCIILHNTTLCYTTLRYITLHYPPRVFEAFFGRSSPGGSYAPPGPAPHRKKNDWIPS